MNISRLWTWKILGASAFALALVTGGCGGGGSSGGSGGTTGNGSGGHGSGGTSGGSGGAASGGAIGSGGKVGGSGGSASGGSTASGGATATGGKVGSGGSSSGGAVGSGGAGTASGGTIGSGGAGTASGGKIGSGGTGTASGGSGQGGVTGSGGATGSGGMGTTTGWQCPAASTFAGMVPFSGTTTAATRIEGAPPLDTFNNMGNNFTNLEGPVWIGDALYYSEMTTMNLPPARILKLAADDTSSVFIDMSGSNGMATDGTNLFTANHGAQGIVKFALADKAKTTIVSMYDGMPFDSPNDLAIAKDGTIYFSDPNWQNNMGKQAATRVYEVAPSSGTATPVTDYTNEPNGVSLSVDETTLFVSGGAGVKKYAISNGKVAMTGEVFGPTEVSSATDGMTLDCAGNLYVAISNTLTIAVIKPDGTSLGTVTLATGMAATNVAFGGTDHQTLYITAQGANKTQGVYKVHLNIPGKPY